jgi:hypothetical protein
MTDLDLAVPLAAPNPATTDWVPLGATQGAMAYGTSLPASPLDGQLAVLVDSVTNPTYQWQFRYNAGSTSAYKWEFVGGAPFSAVDSSTQALTVSVWTGVLPTFTLPRAGDYVLGASGMLRNATDTTAQFGPGVSAAFAAGGGRVIGGWDSSLARENVRANAQTASTVVRPFGYAATTGITAVNALLTVLPVRVS